MYFVRLGFMVGLVLKKTAQNKMSVYNVFMKLTSMLCISSRGSIRQFQ